VDSSQATSCGQVRKETAKLDVGYCCSEEERISHIESLLLLNYIFALADEELSETSLVEQVNDIGKASQASQNYP